MKVNSHVSTEVDRDGKDKGAKTDTPEVREFTGKLKRSSYMVTINSNRSAFAPEFEEKFLNFNKFLFEGNRIVRYMVCKHCVDGKCHNANAESPDAAKCIVEVNLVNKSELGPENGKLHSHTSVSVIHKGSIQINIDKIKKLAYGYFGYKPYISIRGSGDVAFSRELYLAEKSQQSAF